MDERDLLKQQVEYYQARAGEYDQWFLREGRHDRGPEHRARWFREVAIVEAALEKTLQSGEVLELACGTGLWTQHLVKQHSRAVAVDASADAIAINRERVDSDAVEYIVADLFNWTPPAGYGRAASSSCTAPWQGLEQDRERMVDDLARGRTSCPFCAIASGALG